TPRHEDVDGLLLSASCRSRGRCRHVLFTLAESHRESTEVPALSTRCAQVHRHRFVMTGRLPMTTQALRMDHGVPDDIVEMCSSNPMRRREELDEIDVQICRLFAFVVD